MNRKPLSSRAMNHLARHPKAMMDYQMHGRMPRSERPDSPLIRALEAISPRDRARILGVSIHSLGYNYGQPFSTAESLLRWLKPSPEVFGCYPAGSYKQHSFAKRLTPIDVLNCSAGVPEDIRQRYS